jgi:hypothetical protein
MSLWKFRSSEMGHFVENPVIDFEVFSGARSRSRRSGEDGDGGAIAAMAFAVRVTRSRVEVAAEVHGLWPRRTSATHAHA